MNIQKITYRHTELELKRLGKFKVIIKFQMELDGESYEMEGYGNMKHKALENAIHKIMFIHRKQLVAVA